MCYQKTWLGVILSYVPFIGEDRNFIVSGAKFFFRVRKTLDWYSFEQVVVEKRFRNHVQLLVLRPLRLQEAVYFQDKG